MDSVVVPKNCSFLFIYSNPEVNRNPYFYPGLWKSTLTDFNLLITV